VIEGILWDIGGWPLESLAEEARGARATRGVEAGGTVRACARTSAGAIDRGLPSRAGRESPSGWAGRWRPAQPFWLRCG
jgi:hypothetical protein